MIRSSSTTACTTAIEHVAPVWDAETKRYVKGHVVFTAHWVTPGHFPVGFRLKTPSGISKHQLALWLIKKARRFGVLFQTVCSTRGISRRR